VRLRGTARVLVTKLKHGMFMPMSPTEYLQSSEQPTGRGFGPARTAFRVLLTSSVACLTLSCASQDNGPSNPTMSSTTSSSLLPSTSAPVTTDTSSPTTNSSNSPGTVAPNPSNVTTTGNTNVSPSSTSVNDTGANQSNPTSTGTATGTDATSSVTSSTPVVDEALIDDFEDGDATLPAIAERAGQWSAYNDESAGSTQSPAAGKAVTPEASGAMGSGFAMHTSGSGFADWGAGIQMDFKNPGTSAASRLPFDASKYKGISFYAKGTGSPRLELPIPATTDAPAGGSCTEGCLDTHGKAIVLSADWTLHTVAFSELEQEDWGTAADFDPSQLLGLAFKIPGSADDPATFDFWIDDLKFVSVADDTNPDVEPEPVVMEPSSEAGMCKDMGGYNGNASVTYYYFAQGSSEVNCSYAITGSNPDKVAHIVTGDGQYFGAMNTTDYNNSAMCGACVEVTRDGNRKVVITIVDQCPVATNPKCQKGHIDLSVAAFDQIGNRGGGEGYLGTGNGGMAGNISWKYVECPIESEVTFRLKEPDNANWNQLLVQGHKFPLQSVEINGQPTTRQAYNYWEPPDGDMGKEPYEVKVTDVNGGVITTYIEHAAGDIPGGVQQSCQ
jgi:expansin (peptidoglycan-binding protein)